MENSQNVYFLKLFKMVEVLSCAHQYLGMCWISIDINWEVCMGYLTTWYDRYHLNSQDERSLDHPLGFYILPNLDSLLSISTS